MTKFSELKHKITPERQAELKAKAQATTDAEGEQEWIVPCRVTLKGWTIVKARTSEAAEEVVKGGGFDIDYSTAEQVDWEVTGKPKRND